MRRNAKILIQQKLLQRYLKLSTCLSALLNQGLGEVLLSMKDFIVEGCGEGNQGVQLQECKEKWRCGKSFILFELAQETQQRCIGVNIQSDESRGGTKGTGQGERAGGTRNDIPAGELQRRTLLLYLEA